MTKRKNIMNGYDLHNAEEMAKRFLLTVQAMDDRYKADNSAFYGCKESAAVRRASMDLTRALAVLRK